MDRRVDPRVEIRLPCHLSLLRGKSRFLVGITENMSRSGLLVRWNARAATRLPEPGHILALELDLPANHPFGRRCIHCQVTAIRISHPKSGGSLVGFQINQMQFRNYDEIREAAPDSREEFSRLLM